MGWRDRGSGRSSISHAPRGPVSPALGGEIELVQNPKRLLMAYTGSETKWIRQVWIGRQHPKDLTDYEPAWMGHSIGKWEGDTLVVDTVRIKSGHMIDTNSAAPQGPNFHMIERIRLTPDGKLHIDKTFEDPDGQILICILKRPRPQADAGFQLSC